jgi:AcrR family transcriptional regulator
MDEHLSRKEKERLFRRNEILTASAFHFARKGFAKTTIDEISESAEFGKGTIYNYFANKEEIYKSIVEEMLEGNLALLEVAAEAAPDNLEQFLSSYTTSLYKFCFSRLDSFKLLIKELAQLDSENVQIDRSRLKEIMEKMHTLISSVFKKEIEEGKISDFNPEELTMYFNHFIYPALAAQIHCPVRYGDQSEQPLRVLRIFLRGIYSNSNGATN